MTSSFFIDPGGRLRTVWRLLIFCVSFMVAQVVAVLAAYMLMNAVGIAPWTAEAKPTVGMVPVMLAMAGVSLAVVFGCRRLLDRRSLRSLGLGTPERRPMASPWLGLLAGAGAAFLPIGAFLAAGAIRIAGLVPSPSAAVGLLVMLTAAFQEELVYRGYLVGNMVEVGHPWSGALLAALIFTLPHALNPHFFGSSVGAANILVAGVALGFVYQLSGNLWCPIGLHFGWNAVQGVLFNLPVSGIRLGGVVSVQAARPSGLGITEGFGLEGSMLVLLWMLGLATLLGTFLWRKRRGERRASLPSDPRPAGSTPDRTEEVEPIVHGPKHRK